MTHQNAIELEGLRVRYGRSEALADVTLRVATGAVYALLGRNGAGKSTAVRCLLGQQRPDSGTSKVLGRDVWRERAALMSEVGVVPEEPDAPRSMTAHELGRFCASLERNFSLSSYESRLDRFAIPRGIGFGRLSKGQKGHVMLALALAHSPKLLVLDDPTLGLDAIARTEFFEELVVDLADRGTTVFITTHDLAGIEGIATHVGILSGARLVVDEELETLKARFRRVRFPKNDVARQALLELLPLAVAESDWGGEAVVGGFSDPAFERFLRASGASEIEAHAMPLSSIFGAVAKEVTP